MDQLRLSTTLEPFLPRLLERMRLLPRSDDVEAGIALLESLLANWSQMPLQIRRDQAFGAAVLVGEIEHRARLDQLLEAGIRSREARAKGGRGRPAPAWHAECASYARSLLASGRKRRELAGILATKYRKSRDAVADVLKKAGVE